MSKVILLINEPASPKDAAKNLLGACGRELNLTLIGETVVFEGRDDNPVFDAFVPHRTMEDFHIHGIILLPHGEEEQWELGKKLIRLGRSLILADHC